MWFARRWMVVVAAVVCASAAVAAVGPPAGAADPARQLAAEPEGEDLAFARERGITVADAQQRLDWQVLAPDLAERVETSLGALFGGVWIDTADGDRVKVGVAGTITGEVAAAVRDAAEGVGLTEGYDLVEVRRAMSALEDGNAWLGAEIGRVNAGAADTLTAGLRTDLNAIELQVPAEGTLTPAQRDLVASAPSVLGDRLVIASYRGAPTARACVYPYCDPPLRGGIRINHPDASCTGAFIAQSKVDDKLYQFTAGHCAYQNYTNWSTRFTDNSVHVIGPVWTWWWYSGGDFSILRINNVPGWNPTAWVNVTSGPDTSADSTYHISSDNYSVLGMRICTTGAFYGRSDCGYVTQLGVTATYGGVTVHQLGRASFCGIGGDSGSPMYAKHVAYGLQVAGYSECDSLYQGIRAAETKLNVNVLHASS